MRLFRKDVISYGPREFGEHRRALCSARQDSATRLSVAIVVSPTVICTWSRVQDLSESRFRNYQRRFCHQTSIFRSLSSSTYAERKIAIQKVQTNIHMAVIQDICIFQKVS